MRTVLVFLTIVTFCFALGSMVFTLATTAGPLDIAPATPSSEGGEGMTGHVTLDIQDRDEPSSQPSVPGNHS